MSAGSQAEIPAARAQSVRALATAVAGWRGTARSVRWSPVLVTPVVLCLALVVTRAVADPDPGSMSLLGEVSLAFTVFAAAFIADDATLEAAPATPVEAPARLAARAALAVPVVVAGWLLVLVVYDSVTPAAATADLADRALAGSGLGAAALALGALGGRLWAVVSPGAVGVAAMACLAVTSQWLPKAWLTTLPPPEVLWPVTVLLAIATAVAATREPAR